MNRLACYSDCPMYRVRRFFFSQESWLCHLKFSLSLFTAAQILNIRTILTNLIISGIIFTVIVLQKLAWPATGGVSAETPFLCLMLRNFCILKENRPSTYGDGLSSLQCLICLVIRKFATDPCGKFLRSAHESLKIVEIMQISLSRKSLLAFLIFYKSILRRSRINYCAVKRVPSFWRRINFKFYK